MVGDAAAAATEVAYASPLGDITADSATCYRRRRAQMVGHCLCRRRQTAELPLITVFITVSVPLPL